MSGNCRDHHECYPDLEARKHTSKRKSHVKKCESESSLIRAKLMGWCICTSSRYLTLRNADRRQGDDLNRLSTTHTRTSKSFNFFISNFAPLVHHETSSGNSRKGDFGRPRKKLVILFCIENSVYFVFENSVYTS